MKSFGRVKRWWCPVRRDRTILDTNSFQQCAFQYRLDHSLDFKSFLSNVRVIRVRLAIDYQITLYNIWDIWSFALYFPSCISFLFLRRQISFFVSFLIWLATVAKASWRCQNIFSDTARSYATHLRLGTLFPQH